jgi:lipopolysaccharide transport system ATP-binding protein
MTPIIEARNLAKAYTITHDARPAYGSLREDLGRALSRTLRRSAHSTREQLWALDDVSFDVERGEIVGIVGRNGAGKSTLLKILSRIVEPTRGEARMHGRVASLLEVGTGFHPELTGRENIFFNGVLLGMSRREVARKFDEIVAFSEVERFLDTPVKFYSSGMYVRLAFAVAAHLEPEILIVDEVLAVGDAAFQRKSLGKMRDATQDEGRTVLFVSHNTGAVEQLCTKAMWLHRGRLEEVSERVADTVANYLASEGLAGDAAEWRSDGVALHGLLEPHRVAITDDAGGTLRMPVTRTQDAWLRIEATVAAADPDLMIGYAIQAEDGTPVFSSYATDAPGLEWPPVAGRLLLCTRLPLELLNEGRFKVELVAFRRLRDWLFQPGVNAPFVYLRTEGRIDGSPPFGIPRPGPVAPVLAWRSEG